MMSSCGIDSVFLVEPSGLYQFIEIIEIGDNGDFGG
jgi:hypothetical protein